MFFCPSLNGLEPVSWFWNIGIFLCGLNGQVTKRLEKTARYFKNLGTLAFWSQLVCTIVSGGILSFSTVVTGKVTAPFTFYATAAGIAAAFISVFWSFGYIRLSERLRRSAKEPAKVILFGKPFLTLYIVSSNIETISHERTRLQLLALWLWLFSISFTCLLPFLLLSFDNRTGVFTACYSSQR